MGGRGGLLNGKEGFTFIEFSTLSVSSVQRGIEGLRSDLG